MVDTSSQQQKEAGIQDWLVLALLSLIWGTSFILIKKALVAFSYVEVGMLRIGIAAVALLPFLLKSTNLDWGKWKLYLLVGVTGSGIPAFLFSLAQTKISSSATGVLNSTAPIFSLLLGVFFFGVSFRISKLVGVLLGLIGASLLILYGKQSGIGDQPIYALFVIAATFLYGFNINVVKQYFQHTAPVDLTAISFALIGIPALVYILFSSIPQTVLSHDDGLYSLGAVVLLALIGTVFSIILYYRLVQRTNAVFASSVAYLMPIVAIGWGLLDGEKISVFHFLGMLLILIGVYIIRRND